MEMPFPINLPDGKQIHAILRRGEGIASSGRVVLFVHGLSGFKNEHIFFNGSRHFSARGFASLRFDFYDTLPNTRRLSETTLSTWATDLNAVISALSTRFSSVHIVGHSLGCPTILLANLARVSSLTFWEPSMHPKQVFGQARALCDGCVVVMPSRVDFVLRPEVQAEAERIPPIEELLKPVRIPLQIITAGEAGVKIGRDQYLPHAVGPKEFHNIARANHTFDQDGAEQELFAHTLDWIQRN